MNCPHRYLQEPRSFRAMSVFWRGLPIRVFLLLTIMAFASDSLASSIHFQKRHHSPKRTRVSRPVDNGVDTGIVKATTLLRAGPSTTSQKIGTLKGGALTVLV